MKNLVKVFASFFVLMCVQYAQARTITIYNQFSEQLTLSSGMIGMTVKKNDSSVENTHNVIIPAIQSTGVSTPVVLVDMPTFAFQLKINPMPDRKSYFGAFYAQASIPAGNDDLLIDIEPKDGLYRLNVLSAAARRIITIYNRFSEPLRIKVEGNDPRFEQVRKTEVKAHTRSLISGPSTPATTIVENVPPMPFVLELVTIMGNSQKVDIPLGDRNMGIDIDQSGNAKNIGVTEQTAQEGWVKFLKGELK